MLVLRPRIYIYLLQCVYIIYSMYFPFMFLQEKTLESAMTYAVETELSSRVRQWEHRIRPILEEEVRPIIFI